MWPRSIDFYEHTNNTWVMIYIIRFLLLCVYELRIRNVDSSTSCETDTKNSSHGGGPSDLLEESGFSLSCPFSWKYLTRFTVGLFLCSGTALPFLCMFYVTIRWDGEGGSFPFFPCLAFPSFLYRLGFFQWVTIIMTYYDLMDELVSAITGVTRQEHNKQRTWSSLSLFIYIYISIFIFFSSSFCLFFNDLRFFSSDHRLR